MALKKYVVDTNILMSLEQLDKLIEYCEGMINVPIYVVEELDNLKIAEGERGFKARRALRNIKKNEDCIEFYLPKGETSWFLPASLDGGKMDNKIINYALTLKSKYNIQQVVLLSNDLNVRIKCFALGIETNNFVV